MKLDWVGILNDPFYLLLTLLEPFAVLEHRPQRLPSAPRALRLKLLCKKAIHQPNLQLILTLLLSFQQLQIPDQIRLNTPYISIIKLSHTKRYLLHRHPHARYFLLQIEQRKHSKCARLDCWNGEAIFVEFDAVEFDYDDSVFFVAGEVGDGVILEGELVGERVG